MSDGTDRAKALYVLYTGSYGKIYGPAEREDVAKLVDVYAPPQTAESVRQDPAVLGDAEVILSGWGGPRMDEGFLAAAPRLKAFFYGAGSIRGCVTDAFWQRGILLTSALSANAQPVAEYTLSQILFGLKRGWHHAARCKQGEWAQFPMPGAYGSTVGLVSLGAVGRWVCRLLAPFDVRIIAHDPYVSREEAAGLGVELCSLEEVFRRADVVSLHTPNLPQTRGMITGAHFAAMRQRAVFINTARGAVVRETEMVDALRRRPDLWAVLDVTDPEPPQPGGPLCTLPNVTLTPHIAGSMDAECRRMGRLMVEELARYVRGEPLRWQITRERAAIMA